MTPKEKAKELVDKFHSDCWECGGYYEIQNALIAVDEIINEFYTHPIAKIYWKEVKQEIEKL